MNTAGSLVDTSNALVDTSGSLVDTSGMLPTISQSLVDTSNVLVTVNGLAADIEGVLEDAQNPADKLGTTNIVDRVSTANGVLTGVNGDTGNVLQGLKSVNGSLASICQKAGGGRPCS